MSGIRAVLLCLAASTWVSVAAQERSVADSIAAIEGAQSEAGANGLGALTIEELMTRLNVPGVSVAVIRNFEVHWAKGYGVADVETGKPVDTKTLFQAASISKPVTAMAVLKAVQDDVFGLDTDINDILTSWQLDGGEFTRERPVTPRTLTSHTSGLGDGFGFPGYDPGGPIPTVVQILNGESPSNTRRLFMERVPLTLMEYSGGGVTLMQQALADAIKTPHAPTTVKVVAAARSGTSIRKWPPRGYGPRRATSLALRSRFRNPRWASRTRF
jgi:CubicO group peptidase (beta-lactamase class C family)